MLIKENQGSKLIISLIYIKEKGSNSDYIMSWRPNPALVGMGYSIDKCRKAVRRGIKDSRGSHIEIMLKELMTIENDPQRLIDFMNMAMAEALSS